MSFHVLVPLGGSEHTAAVFPLLRFLDSKMEVQLELLACYTPSSSATLKTEEPDVEARLQSYLQAQLQEIDCSKASTRVACGDPVAEILARAARADLVVIVNQNGHELANYFLGGVTSNLTSLCPAPILVAAPAQDPPRLETLLVAVDGSPCAERAFSKAAELAQALGARIVLYRAVKDDGPPRQELASCQEYLRGLANSRPELDIEVRAEKLGWGPLIGECARDCGADAIVMGAHGSRGDAHRTLGSQARLVLARADRSVLLVH